jgi:amidase
MPRSYSAEQSGSLVERFELARAAEGPLAGLRFAVKDLIDIAGYKTACGNPSWRDTHPPATVSAVCVEQLLGAGAVCIGKSVTDELAFSLLGENYFYGTPLNPSAPDRVPGGSSSGSASAVACGLAEFALGTDTGGSVRVPASNCGVWGLRPSHGLISVAGVMPFAPSFDTLGVLAESAGTLERVAAVLLGGEIASPGRAPRIRRIAEAFALADADVRQTAEESVERIGKSLGVEVGTVSLSELAGEATTLDAWYETYCVLQWAEIECSLGAWIADARPKFGPAIAASFNLPKNLDRGRIYAAASLRGRFYRRLKASLAQADIVCLPTVPSSAPAKDTVTRSQASGYYPRALALTSLAGLARLPQVSLPLGRTADSPVGLSMIGAFGEDLHLLAVARQIGASL